MSRPRVVVLGAGGFIGSHVAAALERLGSVDLTLVSRTGGDLSLDVSTAGRSQFAALLRGERPTAIVNAAGATEGDPARLVRGNVVLVSELLAAAAATTPGCRVVQVGSSAEYGAVETGVPIDEDAVPNPVSTYGVTKLAATELAVAAGRSGDVDTVVLRLFNPIGPGMAPNTLVGRAVAGLRAAVDGRAETVVLGPLGDSRDFLDVDDAAEAISAAALREAPLRGRILNVGSGRGTTARELVGLLAAAAGYEGPIEEEDLVGASTRSASVPWQQADVSAIRSTLGWSPGRELAETVERIWREADR